MWTEITAIWMVVLPSAIAACAIPPEDNEPTTPDDALAFGVATQALTCTDTLSIDHATCDDVARERIIRRSSCGDGAIHLSIQLSDTLCDDRAARVHWTLRDITGVLGSGLAVHDGGCRAAGVTVKLPKQATTTTYVIDTILQACNSAGCSTPRLFEDML